jgi:hypothetical protein
MPGVDKGRTESHKGSKIEQESQGLPQGLLPNLLIEFKVGDGKVG